MIRSHSRRIACCVGALALAATAGRVEAQDQSGQAPPQVHTAATEPMNWTVATKGAVGAFAMQAGTPVGRHAESTMFVGPMAPGLELGGKTVTGAPYTADAITETIQTLADGNRIVRRQSTSVARDTQGRTRREMSVTAIGSYVPEDAPKWVMIHDPVAGLLYTLDEQRQTALRQPLPQGAEMAVAFGAGAHGGVSYASSQIMAVGPGEARARLHTEAGSRVTAGGVKQDDAAASSGANAASLPPPPPPPPPAGIGAAAFAGQTRAAWLEKQEGQTESLGTQTIEGVEATGSRTTVTIPAGAIGNEQPIRIVSEQWYSPELQTTVLSKREDPRMGETVYRLSNVARSEPAASLFEVPAGYTVTDPEEHMRVLKSRRP